MLILLCIKMLKLIEELYVLYDEDAFEWRNPFDVHEKHFYQWRQWCFFNSSPMYEREREKDQDWEGISNNSITWFNTKFQIKNFSIIFNRNASKTMLIRNVLQLDWGNRCLSVEVSQYQLGSLGIWTAPFSSFIIQRLSDDHWSKDLTRLSWFVLDELLFFMIAHRLLISFSEVHLISSGDVIVSWNRHASFFRMIKNE